MTRNELIQALVGMIDDGRASAPGATEKEVSDLLDSCFSVEASQEAEMRKKKSEKPRERLLSTEEIGHTIYQEVQELGRGLRGRKRQKYLREAVEWWKKRLREVGDSR